MAIDVQDAVREFINRMVEDAGKGVDTGRETLSGGRLSGMKGVAAGAGAAALAPIAAKGLGKLARTVATDGIAAAPGKAVQGVTSKVGDTISGGVGDKLSEKLDDAGGPGGLLKGAVKGALPFGDGDDDDGGDDRGIPGVGKGRRMPVQQSVDIGAPLETVYNQWTQFEQWTNFMHRVTRVSQIDDCTVSFSTKIWGKTKEFTAKIETQRPDERVKWRVTQGMNHTGVVTFHELGPQLTRVLLGLDVEPGGMLEKAARGMRHVKRAARGDLHRFKAFVEMQGQETGAWRGVIEGGKVAKKHDASYDKRRNYLDFEDAYSDSKDGEDPKKQSSRGSRQRQSGQGRRASSRSGSGSNGRSASSGSSRGSASSGSSGRGASSGSSRRSASGRTSSRNGGSSGSSSASRSRSNGRSTSSGRSSSGNHTDGRSRSRGRG